MVYMHRIEFGTACQRGDRLARIQQPERIETLTNQVELITLGFTELDTHFAELLDADAMLTGDGATAFDTQLQNLAAQLLGFFRAHPRCWNRTESVDEDCHRPRGRHWRPAGHIPRKVRGYR